MEQLSEKLYDYLSRIPKSYYLPIFLSLIGIVMLGYGFIQFFNSNKGENTQLYSTQETVSSSSALPALTMQVDIEGAVVSPGVYKLPQNARVQDALIAAGGLSGQADRDVVAKSLNLATKLTDGVKLYVPKIGDSSVIPAEAGIQSSNSTVLGAAIGLININSASESQLDSLPGIGPVTAQKIIAARPYASIEDLKAKKVVSSSVFEKIKDKITAY